MNTLGWTELTIEYKHTIKRYTGVSVTFVLLSKNSLFLDRFMFIRFNAQFGN